MLKSIVIGTNRTARKGVRPTARRMLRALGIVAYATPAFVRSAVGGADSVSGVVRRGVGRVAKRAATGCVSARRIVLVALRHPYQISAPYVLIFTLAGAQVTSESDSRGSPSDLAAAMTAVSAELLASACRSATAFIEYARPGEHHQSRPRTHAAIVTIGIRN